MKNNELLKLERISKSFATKVLDDVSFSVGRGEIVALLGENGAGKSTLMKIISGIYQADDGSVYFENKKLELKGPREAQDIGISIIHQELNIVRNRSVGQNIFLGREPKKRTWLGKLGGVDNEKMYKASIEALKMVNARHISVKDPADLLSTAQLQLVEIARSLSMNAKIILMDEPTSSLTEDQSEVLIKIMKQLKEDGIGIVFTTHRIKEAFKIADRFIILRDGCLIANKKASQDITYEHVIEWMIGRPIKDLYPKIPIKMENEIFRAEHISGGIVKDASFSVNKGEILGFGGLVGAGRTELLRLILGIDIKNSGITYFKGQKVDIKNLKEAIRLGIGFVPEDKINQSLILKQSVKFNIVLAGLTKLSKKGVFIDNRRINMTTKRYIDKLSIRLHSSNQPIDSLSGGNQQKAILAKWMLLHPDFLVLDEPTRGVDVGAKAEIYQLLGELVKNNITVILISSDLPELIGLSDRIVVMSEGKIMRILDKNEASPQKVMYYAGLNEKN